jgi:N-formylmaleamate deformylase
VGAELDDRLAVDRETDLVLDRQRANPFYATQLDSYLTARGVDTVVICGATTSGCIRSTADGALAHGYRGIIPYGTVDDRSTASHNAHLWDIDMKVADVRPFDEVAAYLAEPTDT